MDNDDTMASYYAEQEMCDDASREAYLSSYTWKTADGQRLYPRETDDLPFVEWGNLDIQSEAQARQAACNFAAYVS